MALPDTYALSVIQLLNRIFIVNFVIIVTIAKVLTF